MGRSGADRVRLDQLLVDRGLFESRAKAAGSVLAGEVGVSAGVQAKPGTRVRRDVEVTLAERPRYVSRGGLKLERVLNELAVPVAGRRCLDAGASTGGFTDCLLQAGAAQVLAVDVAYGQLDWRLRQDGRVTVLERRNVRDLEPGDLPWAPELVTVDVSFIGLAKVLPALAGCAAEPFDLLALVKPQFELGRGRVGRGGVVREPGDRLEALVAVGEQARELGLSVLGYCASGLPGPAGNRESFIWCAEGGRGGIGDVRAAALVAEPEATSKAAEEAAQAAAP